MGNRQIPLSVRNAIGKNASPPLSSLSTSGMLGQQSPHKIFLWNAEGVYVDCAFPNPIHGHFMGGTQVGGAHLTDLFTQTVSQYIFNTLTKVFTKREEQKIVVDLERQNRAYQAHIHMLPMGHHVMGWVTDQLANHEAVPPLCKNPPRISLANAELFMTLTNQEKKVVMAFGSGHSNRQIGDLLDMSERMVKFHMQNLLQKLNLPSRAHLASLRLFESDFLNP